jgi:pilus assembly protein FimV
MEPPSTPEERDIQSLTLEELRVEAERLLTLYHVTKDPDEMLHLSTRYTKINMLIDERESEMNAEDEPQSGAEIVIEIEGESPEPTAAADDESVLDELAPTDALESAEKNASENSIEEPEIQIEIESESLVEDAEALETPEAIDAEEGTKEPQSEEKPFMVEPEHSRDAAYLAAMDDIEEALAEEDHLRGDVETGTETTTDTISEDTSSLPPLVESEPQSEEKPFMVEPEHSRDAVYLAAMDDIEEALAEEDHLRDEIETNDGPTKNSKPDDFSSLPPLADVETEPEPESETEPEQEPEHEQGPEPELEDESSSDFEDALASLTDVLTNRPSPSSQEDSFVPTMGNDGSGSQSVYSTPGFDSGDDLMSQLNTIGSDSGDVESDLDEADSELPAVEFPASEAETEEIPNAQISAADLQSAQSSPLEASAEDSKDVAQDAEEPVSEEDEESDPFSTLDAFPPPLDDSMAGLSDFESDMPKDLPKKEEPEAPAPQATIPSYHELIEDNPDRDAAPAIPPLTISDVIPPSTSEELPKLSLDETQRICAKCGHGTPLSIETCESCSFQDASLGIVNAIVGGDTQQVARLLNA